jgi:hypothetical protein
VTVTQTVRRGCQGGGCGTTSVSMCASLTASTGFMVNCNSHRTWLSSWLTEAIESSHELVKGILNVWHGGLLPCSLLQCTIALCSTSLAHASCAVHTPLHTHTHTHFTFCRVNYLVCHLQHESVMRSPTSMCLCTAAQVCFLDIFCLCVVSL